MEHETTDTSPEFVCLMDEASEIGTRPQSQKPILRNVVLLGSQSRDTEGNVRREYAAKALRDGARLFEGVKVYRNHDSRGPGHAARPVQDVIGVVHKPYYAENENKIRGNIHIVQAPDTQHVMWLAEHEPATIGISPDMQGAYVMRSGIQYVSKLLVVKSADMVTDPATTEGLHESKSTNNNPTEGGENNMDWKDLTLDTLKVQRPDLAKALMAESTAEAEVDKLRKENSDLKSDIETRDKAEKDAALDHMTESLPEKLAESVRQFAEGKGIEEVRTFAESLRESLPSEPPTSTEKQDPGTKTTSSAIEQTAIAGMLS